MAKEFERDDLVWAKMKGYPPWPARIALPPEGKVPKAKKPQHYVFFFGTHDHAWIADADIEPHSDSKLESAKAIKKKSATMLLGIQEIEEASQTLPKKSKPPPKEKDPVADALSSAPDSPSTPHLSKSVEKPKPKLFAKKRDSSKDEKNIVKKTPKKTAKKRSASNVDLNASRVRDEDLNEDLRFLVANVPPNNKHLNEAAVVPPYEESPLVNGAGFDSACSSILLQTPKRLKGNALSPTDKKIGFLGLGAMGAEMAMQLLATDHKVTIWNRSHREAEKALVKAGATTAPNPAAVVQECDITLCCVLDSEAVKNVVKGRDGVLEGFDGHGSGKAYIEMSSIDPTTSQELAEAISGKGGKYLEAPMVGERQDVANRSIVIIGAGDRGVFIECESLWAAWSQNAFYVSPDAGYASKLSLILKTMTGVSCAALSECMGLLQQCGIAPQGLIDTIRLSPCNFPLLLRKSKAMAEEIETVRIPVKHQQNDMAMAVSLGDSTQQPLVLAVAASDAFVRAAARDPDSDMTSIHQNTPVKVPRKHSVIRVSP